MAVTESSDLPFDIDEKFIEQNKKSSSKNIMKREGGPYTKSERDKRQQEVYKLHFEYGYSARKISELMKVNRNTINGDIDYWYSKIHKNANIFNPEDAVIVNLERLEIQRSRLREQLDKTKTFQERLALERMIYEIDCKILYTYTRMAESTRRLLKFSTDKLNRWMKDNKREERYLTLLDKISVSEKAHEKINKIIKEDRSHPR
ncbi:MAG: hypothetical protein WA799_04130 [Nitrosotalea sp.]